MSVSIHKIVQYHKPKCSKLKTWKHITFISLIRFFVSTRTYRSGREQFSYLARYCRYPVTKDSVCAQYTTVCGCYWGDATFVLATAFLSDGAWTSKLPNEILWVSLPYITNYIPEWWSEMGEVWREHLPLGLRAYYHGPNDIFMEEK
jgi:hypothetical protein